MDNLFTVIWLCCDKIKLFCEILKLPWTLAKEVTRLSNIVKKTKNFLFISMIKSTIRCITKLQHNYSLVNPLTWGQSPPEWALRLISSTVFFLEFWSDRDTNTGLMYFIKAGSKMQRKQWNKYIVQKQLLQKICYYKIIVNIVDWRVFKISGMGILGVTKTNILSTEKKKSRL